MRIPNGEELRSARNRQNLTQAELAERAGVSQPLIARIESEDVDVTLDTLHSIVSALNNSTATVDQTEISLVVPAAIKNARTRAGFTQGELAERADVSQPLISRIENQDVNPRVSTLRSLLEHINITPTSDANNGTDTQQTDMGVLPTIEAELEKLRIDTDQGKSTSYREESSTETSRCGNCNEGLEEYPDPIYCPACGNEL